jgi:hypothetical protein
VKKTVGCVVYVEQCRLQKWERSRPVIEHIQGHVINLDELVLDRVIDAKGTSYGRRIPICDSESCRTTHSLTRRPKLKLRLLLETV